MPQYEVVEGVGRIHHVSSPEPAHWSDVDTERLVAEALAPTAEHFASICERAEKIGTPAIDRTCSMVVGLKPRSTEVSADSVMFVAELDQVPRDSDSENPTALLELFTVKATARAFSQAKRGIWTDLSPMEHIKWLSDFDLYRGANASAGGLHVGVAGPWPHHSRDLARTFVANLANGLGVPYRIPAPENTHDPQASEVRMRRKWLDAGRDAGDNSPGQHDFQRARYGFILDLLKQ